MLCFIIGIGGCLVGAICLTKSKRAFIINAIVTVILLIAWIVILVVQNQNVIGDAQIVASVGESKRDNVEIYYDVEEDMYFKVDNSKWDVFDLYDRTYLDSDVVRSYLENKENKENFDNLMNLLHLLQ
jgi:hypothetical protein